MGMLAVWCCVIAMLLPTKMFMPRPYQNNVCVDLRSCGYHALNVIGVRMNDVDDMIKLRETLAKYAGPHVRRIASQFNDFSMEANLSMP